MKRNLIFIILMTLYLSIYAENFDVLNGIWRSQNFYDALTNNPQSSIGYAGDGMRKDTRIEIEIQSDETGSFWYVNPFAISQLEQQGNEFVFHLAGFVADYEYDSESDSYVCVSETQEPAGEIAITVIDEDSIFANFGGFGQGDYEEPWYRVSGPAKIPLQYGVINDTRVRLRTKPNLECDTWGFFNTGDAVTIIDKSAEKQKIDDMEDYWYKVQTELFPDGWVYGAFIDIED